MRLILCNSSWSSDPPRFDEAAVRRVTDGWDYDGYTRSKDSAVIYVGPGLWTPGGVDEGTQVTSLAANEEGVRILRDARIIA